MAELKSTLVDIVQAIVDHPEYVDVSVKEEAGEINMVLHVAAEDMGMVIGRHGRIAKAIRTVMKAAASGTGKKVNVEIR